MQKRKVHTSKIIYALISVVSFLAMIYYSNVIGMWTDELSIIGTIELNNPNSEYIVCLILKWFYNIMPYGQRYLFVPIEMVTALGIFFLGLIGEKLYSKRLGYFMCILGGSSQYVFVQIAHEFRPYFMLFFSSIIVFYLFICRNKETESKFYLHILYGLALLGVIDSHEYGKLLVCFYIFADLLLVLLKGNKKITLISDFFPIIYGIYWVTHTTVGSLVNSYQWTERPTPYLIWNTLNMLCGRSNIVLWCMFIGIGCILLKLFSSRKEIKENIVDVINYFLPLIIFIGIFFASIFYSLFINPENSLFVERYFVSVLLAVYYMAGIGFELLFQLISNLFTKQNKQYMLVIYFVVFLSVFVTEWRALRENPGIGDCTYRELADKLRTCEDVYSDNTVIVFSDWNEVILGWNYYFTEKDKEQRANCISQLSLNYADLDVYDTIYVVSQHDNINTDLLEYLKTNYHFVYNDDTVKLQKYER